MNDILNIETIIPEKKSSNFSADFLLEQININAKVKETVTELDKEIEKAQRKLKWLEDLKNLYVNIDKV